MPSNRSSDLPNPQLPTLFVTGNLSTGGAQAQMLALLDGFLKQGHPCWLLDLNPALRNHRFASERLSEGATEIPAHTTDWHHFADASGISVVISFSPEADVFVHQHLIGQPGITFICRQCGDYNRHEAESANPVRWRQGIGPLLQSFDLHVSQHRGHQALLQRCGVSPKAIHLLRNGVTKLPAQISSGWTNNTTLRMVLCARGEARKGWAEAVAATRQLLAAGFDVSLDLIGEGPVFDCLSLEPSSERIRWRGFVAAPIEVLHGYDLGLLPTNFDTEGQPNTIVEYMAAGLVTIASDIGGIPWLVCEQPDGPVGLLHQPGVANDLAAKILRYLEAPHLYAEHRAAVLNTRKRFAMEAVTTDWLQMIVR